jgi:hypothetical protein
VSWLVFLLCFAPCAFVHAELVRTGHGECVSKKSGTYPCRSKRDQDRPRADSVRTSHGEYVSKKTGIYLCRSSGDQDYLWPEPWSAVAHNGDDVVIWCQATASLRSLSGGWRWSPYRSGCRLSGDVPELRLVRGVVVLVWPGYVACVRRGVCLFATSGKYLGCYGKHILVDCPGGVGIVDNTGRLKLVLNNNTKPKTPGGTSPRVLGDTLLVKRSGRTLAYSIPHLIKGRLCRATVIRSGRGTIY